MKSMPNLTSKHVAIALGFGALSTLIASWGELGFMMDIGQLPSTFIENPDPVTILLAVIIAPFVEELAKPLGLYFLRYEEKPNLNLQEWALLGALAGLGFAIVENVMYASGVLQYGNEAAAMLLLLRFMLPLHMIASAVTGYGFGLWVKTKNTKYFAGCLAVAMLLHGLFNLAASVVG